MFAWLLQILLILSPLLLLVAIPATCWIVLSAYGSSQGAISSAFEWTSGVVNLNAESFVNFWAHAASGIRVPSQVIDMMNAPNFRPIQQSAGQNNTSSTGIGQNDTSHTGTGQNDTSFTGQKRSKDEDAEPR